MNQYETQSATLGLAFGNTVAAALKTVPGAALVNAAKIRLSKDPAFNPTQASLIADLTPHEADFSGYPAGGIAAVLTVGVQPALDVIAALASALFISAPAGPYVPNSCYGYWVDDGTNVIVAERFADGDTANFAVPGDFLSLVVLFPFLLLVATQV